MTVQEYQAGCIERAGRTLAFYVETTLPERREWKPEVEGAAGLRSALDVVSECILVNGLIANILRTGQIPATNPVHGAPRPFANAAEAGPMLEESARELANTVRAMTDDDLTREFPWRRGPVSGAGLIEIPLRNMHYHGGQVNLLQLLYGDTEFRVPPPPTPKV
jgi:hypothetical protein